MHCCDLSKIVSLKKQNFTSLFSMYITFWRVFFIIDEMCVHGLFFTVRVLCYLPVSDKHDHLVSSHLFYWFNCVISLSRYLLSCARDNSISCWSSSVQLRWSTCRDLWPSDGGQSTRWRSNDGQAVACRAAWLRYRWVWCSAWGILWLTWV